MKCTKCGKSLNTFTWAFSTQYDEHYCIDCMFKYFRLCDHCGEYTSLQRVYEKETGDYICHDCYDHLTIEDKPKLALSYIEALGESKTKKGWELLANTIYKNTRPAKIMVADVWENSTSPKMIILGSVEHIYDLVKDNSLFTIIQEPLGNSKRSIMIFRKDNTFYCITQ